MWLGITMAVCGALGIWGFTKERETKKQRYAWFAVGCSILFFIMLAIYLSPEE